MATSEAANCSDNDQGQPCAEGTTVWPAHRDRAPNRLKPTAPPACHRSNSTTFVCPRYLFHCGCRGSRRTENPSAQTCCPPACWSSNTLSDSWHRRGREPNPALDGRPCC